MIGEDNADDRTGAAIRGVADVPAPPVTTTLDTVVRRGRRRALVQRGATVAAVVGVVAAIGVGGALLRSATEGQGVRPAGPSPTTVRNTSTAPPSTQLPPTGENAPGNEPPSSQPLPPQPELLPGWSWADAPVSPDGESCDGAADVAQPHDLPLPDQAAVRAALVDSVRAATKIVPQVVYQSWEKHSPRTDAPRGYLELNVDMGDGPGSVQLEVGTFGATPREAADADVAVYGNCDRPMRRTLDSGAVLQLYQADYFDPRAPMQHFGIYLPGGRHYILTTAGYGESDKVDVGGGGSTIDGGRGRLPLDSRQLAGVGVALAALGS
jgi:hypothetical protein